MITDNEKFQNQACAYSVGDQIAASVHAFSSPLLRYYRKIYNMSNKECNELCDKNVLYYKTCEYRKERQP